MIRHIFLSYNKSSGGESGFTLVELITVIAIMGVLLSIATINFRHYRVKSGIENQTREMYADINSARIDSIHTKKRHAVILNTNSYALKNFTTNEPTTAGRTLVTRAIPNAITKEGGTTYANEMILFDIRGFTDFGTTLVVNPLGNEASQNCIVVSASRINMGRVASDNTCQF
ncbi:prepilin-type N-terminal cleavage/methylation domain-containing protein [Geobacter pelophilus]|uniref:Prepilin-type N-terminal cleavage/methylation domain-containing protein n=1 Tax=Geoanaerobacter pelophilus TaxID=60036 RepID=A0AAW4L624_9BACT|nr:prepilin-type N-terminal cleavage/methylation domain-containing protein [Geoanaerobacter pelophilus]MBT0665627.1 prepilin-type N-terminal cleavage/methylation domain-containing protein [Geoanaerobacter pelophilus]